MGISRRTSLAQKRRWRPSLIEIVAKTCRKHTPALMANIVKHNALFRRLREID